MEHPGGKTLIRNVCDFSTNSRGGKIRHNKPKEFAQVQIPCKPNPSLAIVSSLLLHGAEVTPSLLFFTEKMEDKQFHNLLQRRADQDFAEQLVRVQAWSAANVAQALMNRADNAVMAKRLQEQIEVLQQSVACQNQALEAVLGEFRAQTTELEAQVEILKKRVVELELLLQKGTESAVHGVTFPTPAISPADVKKLFHVVADFTPRNVDEITLKMGQLVFCNLEYRDGWGTVSWNSFLTLCVPHKLSNSTALYRA